MWNEPFLFQDGTVASSLDQLVSKLQFISDNEFFSHVTSSKNDFSQWISHIGHAKLGEFTKTIKDRQTMINVITQYVESHANKPQPIDPTPVLASTPAQPVTNTVEDSKPVRNEVPTKAIAKDAPPDIPIPDTTDAVPPEQTTPVADKPQDVDEQSIFAHDTPAQTAPSQSQPTSRDKPKPDFLIPDDTAVKTDSSTEGHDEFKPSSEHKPAEQSAPGQQNAAAMDVDEQSIFAHDSGNTNAQSLPDGTAPNVQIQTEEDVIDEATCREYADYVDQLKFEIGKVFIGQNLVVHNIILSLMCDAHTLMEGVPGLAKSLLVEVLAKTISDTKFKRIQFLPDMLPSDVVGGQIYNPKTNEFVTIKGPIFANFVLADEINRAPPKTHAAVMEAMAEKKINIDKEEFILERPFLVLATQNPLENKGTYELPEAVLDRFMFKVFLDYPTREDEMKIITENATTKVSYKAVPKVVMAKKEFRAMQKNIPNVHLSEKIRGYILDLVEASRGKNPGLQGNKFIKYGAGVRGSIFLGVAAKAQAVSEGRNYVLPKDIVAIVKPTFIHRVLPNFKGKAYNITSERLVEEILSKVTLL